MRNDHESHPTLGDAPRLVFLTDAWPRVTHAEPAATDLVVVAHLTSVSPGRDLLGDFLDPTPDIAWVAVRSGFVRHRLLSRLSQLGIPALVMDSTGRWARAADVRSAELDLGGLSLRNIRLSVMAMIRVARALASPGFICVDIADFHVFVNHPDAGARFVAESVVLLDEDAATGLDRWMSATDRVADATVCVELSRTFDDLNGLFWHLCNRLTAYGAVEPPTMLPLVPMDDVRRRGSMRATRLFALAPLSKRS